MSAFIFSPKLILTALISLSLGFGYFCPQQEQETAKTKSKSSDENEKTKTKFEPLFVKWKKPAFALFISGRQHGYIEPCGCTGLDKQKGGMLRRDTFRRSLIAKGWNLIPIDAGNQIRRFGQQPFIKLSTTWSALSKIMGYQAVAFGPDDLKTSDVDLLSSIENAKVKDQTPFVAANIKWIEDGFGVTHKVVKSGKYKIGITAILGNKYAKKYSSDVFTVSDSDKALEAVIPKLRAERCNVMVLISHSTLEDAARLAKKFPSFDVLVTTGGAGEPKQVPDEIKVGEHTTSVVQVGTKGMHVGVIGFFEDKGRLRLQYQRVPMDHRFKDSEAIKKVFKAYQAELKIRGLKNLGIKPVGHPLQDGDKHKRRYVGSDSCKDCHPDAYDVWKKGKDGKGGPHYRATKDLTDPGERTWVTREHDPECLSCHVTGWNPQKYFPYESGYLKLADKLLHGNGCENCHGPGSRHVDAENGDIDVDEETQAKYVKEMIVTLAEAKANLCISCHDIDNSPDFEFEKYWKAIEHYEDDE